MVHLSEFGFQKWRCGTLIFCYIAMKGDVMVVHSSNQSRILNCLNHQVLRGHRHIVPGVTKSVCIHVLVEHVMVNVIYPHFYSLFAHRQSFISYL